MIARWWTAVENGVQCRLCPHRCHILPGETGRCLARRNRKGRLLAESYGVCTSIALDPVEKKPLRRFYPGSTVLSLGSYGCNMDCSFCQNHAISTQILQGRFVAPDELDKLCRQAGNGCIGVAFTYNEPLIGFEYLLSCAKLICKKGWKVIVVSNGMLCPEPLEELLPCVDAWNIDLKAFRPAHYRELGGDLDTVLHTIEAAVKVCHVEITTLVVPGWNDSPREMTELAAWLASVDKEIPLHVSRFFPRHRKEEASPTSVDQIYGLADLARQHLSHVYTGNC